MKFTARVRPFILIGLVVIAVAALTHHQPEIPAATTLSEPFNVVNSFYWDLTANNWDGLVNLVTPTLWNYFEESGFLQDWSQIRKQNPELKFRLFVVDQYLVRPEAGEAWMLGEPQWSEKRPEESYQTINLVLQDGRWLIKSIEQLSAVETADSFYDAINRGDWRSVNNLLAPAYRNQLTAAGILSALREDYRTAQNGVYVVFQALDYAQDGDTAWVKADVLWQPASAQSKETPATIKLQKAKGNWLISSITGHWKLTK